MTRALQSFLLLLLVGVCRCAAVETLLQNNSTLTNLHGGPLYFRIDVPTNQARLTIETSGGSKGDCDLYVRFGATATSRLWDFRSFKSGNDERVSIANPQPGSWFIYLEAYEVYAGVTLRMIYNAAPTITKQPIGAAIEPGENVTFAVEASGDQPMAFLWRKNGAPIGISTNLLLISAATASDAGSYSVTVTNAFGSAISSNAVLSVRDVTSPTLTVAAPTPNQRFTNNVVAFSGTAYDRVGVAAVEFQVGTNAFKAATGTTNWTGSATFASGLNTLRFRARDMSGNVSDVFSETIFVDFVPPEVVIASPANNTRLTNQVAALIKGSASDNDFVTGVYVSVNGTDWTLADGTTNWQANVILALGTNVVRICATDTAGLRSKTNSLFLTRVAFDTLLVNIAPANSGALTPNLGGQFLEIGKTYSMTAAAKTGFVFDRWTGFVATNKAALTFTMVEGATLTANFRDVTPPTLTILSPKAAASVTNQVIVATGTASDNFGLHELHYKIDAFDWTSAPGKTNWSIELPVAPGAHTFQIYANDDADNRSRTNSVSFTVPSYKGIYIGTFANSAKPTDKGFAGAIIRGDRTGFFFGANSTFGATNAPAFANIAVAGNGSFNVAGITGVVTATALTARSGTRTFSFVRRVDTGAQAANAGYYKGRYTFNSVDAGDAHALLSADSQFLIVHIGDLDQPGGAGRATMTSQNALATLVGSLGVSGALTPSKATINGQFASKTKFTVQRFATAAVPLAPEWNTDTLNAALAIGDVTIAFATVPGRDYMIQTSLDLESWENAASFTAQSSEFIYREPNPRANAQFYRVLGR